MFQKKKTTNMAIHSGIQLQNGHNFKSKEKKFKYTKNKEI